MLYPITHHTLGTMSSSKCKLHMDFLGRTTDNDHDQVIFFRFGQCLGRRIQKLLGELTGWEGMEDPGVLLVFVAPHREADDSSCLLLLKVGHQVPKWPLSRGCGVRHR